MIFLCVGPIKKMLEFLLELNCALRKLEKVVQVFYVGYKATSFDEEGKEYEMKRKEMCNITSLSLFDVKKFWERIKYLWDDLLRKCDKERTVQVRSMVLAFLSACDWREMLRGLRAKDKRLTKGAEEMLSEVEARRERKEMPSEMEAQRERAVLDEMEKFTEDVIRRLRTTIAYEQFKEGKGISIVAVDENGEMINGLAEEVVQVLCKSGQEEEQDKLMGEIKTGGFTNVLRRRWRDRTICPKSHPHHPMLFKLGEVNCFKCIRMNKKPYSDLGYVCSICRDYKMCEMCFLKE